VIAGQPSYSGAVACAICLALLAPCLVCAFVNLGLMSTNLTTRSRFLISVAVTMLSVALVIACAKIIYNAQWVDYRRRH
jgi:hypothetical protein